MRVFILKPDGIGDFVLATGALRLLAREFGEENLLICVKSLLAPLAQSQFPRAIVLALPVAARRKVINLFAWNLAVCLPVWFRLQTRPAGVAVCLRSMRNYLETFLFVSARAGRRVASENILLRGKRRVRTTVETTLHRLLATELTPYPERTRTVPFEIEAHRRVVARVLGREVGVAEVLPVLTVPATPTTRDEAFWICAPITNLASKLYPLTKWRDIFRELMPEVGHKKILLVGSDDQRAPLEELCALLRDAGCSGTEIFFPADLVEYVKLIAAAELILTVDTAAAHFATALDRPTVVLFSGLHLGMFGPWHRSERQCWLMKPDETKAQPDENRAQPDENRAQPGENPVQPQKKRKWHAGISPERVAAAVRRLMEPGQPAPSETS